MGYREAEKGDSRQSKERSKNDGGGEQPRRKIKGKPGEMVI